VIGSGIAGLSYALSVADSGKVAIVTKDRAKEGSTRYAQVYTHDALLRTRPN
jgi:L-aspartate oxidase